MAIAQTLQTTYGEIRSLYVRINTVSVGNHGTTSETNQGGVDVVLFRGFVGETEFRAGGGYVWELEIEMELDVSLPLWPQAYEFLKTTEQFQTCTDC